MATSKSTAFAVVVRTPAAPPAHLNDAGQVTVRLPVASCVINQLIVWPSLGLLSEGATVTLAVKVVVNTFDRAQSIAIAVAENVTTTGAVWANVKRPPAGAVPPIAGGEAAKAVKPAPLTVLVADSVVNAPAAGAVLPIDGGEAAKAVKPAPLTVLVADKVVNAPAAGVVPPIAAGAARYVARYADSDPKSLMPGMLS